MTLIPGDPKKLVAARQAKRQWYLDTAQQLLDKFKVTATYRPCRGYAKVKSRHIECPMPTGYKSFFTLLHELGHIEAEGASYTSGVSRAVAEYRATEWACQMLKELGQPVKYEVKRSYDDYVREKIARGLRRGLQEIPKEVRHLAKGVTKNWYR